MANCLVVGLIFFSREFVGVVPFVTYTLNDPLGFKSKGVLLPNAAAATMSDNQQTYLGRSKCQ